MAIDWKSLNPCCGCMELKTGCLVIGYLNMTGQVILIIFALVGIFYGTAIAVTSGVDADGQRISGKVVGQKIGDVVGQTIRGNAMGQTIGGNALGQNIGNNASGQTIGGNVSGQAMGGNAFGQAIGGNALGQAIGGGAMGQAIGGVAMGQAIKGGAAVGKAIGGGAVGQTIGGVDIDDDDRQIVGAVIAAVFIVLLVYVSFFFVFTILLVVGIHKNKRRLVKVYHVFSEIWWLVGVIETVHHAFHDFGAKSLVSEVAGLMIEFYFGLVIKCYLKKMGTESVPVFNTISESTTALHLPYA